jgi:hypothetical protein
MRQPEPRDLMAWVAEHAPGDVRTYEVVCAVCGSRGAGIALDGREPRSGIRYCPRCLPHEGQPEEARR